MRKSVCLYIQKSPKRQPLLSLRRWLLGWKAKIGRTIFFHLKIESSMKIKAKHYDKDHSYENSPLRRVKRSHKCEICGKPDWCNYSEDGVFALCMRVSAGSIKQAKNGAYVHVLIPSYAGFMDSSISSAPIERGGIEESIPTVVASADQKHAAYSFLLGECLSLSQSHKERLQNYRCLSETTIEKNLYASL